MTGKIVRLPILLFCMPFVYISLVLDTLYHSSFGFMALLFVCLAIGFYSKATNQLKWWTLGNVVSTILSLVLQSKHPDWQFIYQPFHPTLLVLGLSGLYVIPQLIGIFWATFLKASSKE
ncbi:hypothetical protein [Enterococcus mediterraneensis]|uniref:hypothetical protein n=1 Tax=Enterococcus mediterraneensis TaxID=2364791 RepID=UPI000F05D3E5|nr:hypothetical protein [Enterococcus mediterraneensis]